MCLLFCVPVPWSMPPDCSQERSEHFYKCKSSPASGIVLERTCVCTGASFFYEAGGLPFEAQEVRAFGLLLAEMADRISSGGGGGFWARCWPFGAAAAQAGGGDGGDAASGDARQSVKYRLAVLAVECCQPRVYKRPSFAGILEELQGLAA